MDSVDTPRFQLQLPAVQEISLESFHLYGKEPNVSICAEKPVFCIIGANGLGKSTFLNALIFGMTGAIPVRDKFLTMDEYARKVMRVHYVRDYFGGRLPERSRSSASVSLRLEWPGCQVEVTRPIFEEGGAGHFKVSYIKDGEIDSVRLYEGLSQFESIVTKLSGLKDFDHFVFLIHFVCVFDEDRHLLLWDQRALSAAIMFAFGQSQDQLKEQDKLVEDIRRADSRARNAKFMAKKAEEQIHRIEEFLESGKQAYGPTDQELEREHERLLGDLEGARIHLASKDKELRSIEGEWGSKSAELSEARMEYTVHFAARSKKTSAAFYHPIIRASITEDRCAVCGAEGVSALIQNLQDHSQCPLCNSTVSLSDAGSDIVQKIETVDKRIELYSRELEAIVERRRRVNLEREAALLSEQAAQDALDAFVDERPEANFKFDRKELEGVPEGLKSLRDQRHGFVKEISYHRKERDQLRRKLSALESEASRRYEQFGGAFVNRFKELAGSFIGLPIDIVLTQKERANSTGFDIDLRMNETIRATDNAVSESQRFFLDIALRMALIGFVARGESILIIDTPEGSLDIAYEARAGRMFSDFAREKSRIFMTANLRSSALLEELAEIQGDAGMQLVKMTEWAELSEVQKAEEQRFERAYQEIERHLK